MFNESQTHLPFTLSLSSPKKKGGNTLGFSSMIVFFPEADLVITTLTNTYAAILPNVLHYYLADEILNLPRTKDWTGQVALTMTERKFNSTAEAARGNFPPRQKNKPTSHPLIQYEGAYSNPLFAGDITITLEEDKKTLHFQFTTLSSRMEHYHYESFTIVLDMFSVKVKEILTFFTGTDGQVQGLQIEYLDKKWTFEKKPSSSSSSMIKNKVACHEVMNEVQDEVEFEQDEEEEEEQDVFSQEYPAQFRMHKNLFFH